jgi:HD-GYP domain-containing protein (c-di-GMP phosphodiesterase class II)
VAAQITSLQRQTYILLGGGLAILYCLLFGIVRAGSNTIAVRQRALRRHSDELEQTYRETIMSLAAAVDARDSSTELHSLRVRDLALELGRQMNLRESELRDLGHGAMVHDIGKIGVPDGILRKPSTVEADATSS